MFRNVIKILLLLIYLVLPVFGESCTIVAISGRVTADGRPMLFKTRDGSANDINIKIGTGVGTKYLSLCDAPNGIAFSGYNEAGFSIVSSHSYNMPNPDYWWNAQMIQWALERCSTVDEFEYLLDTITKPIPVRSNYGVMDAQGNVAIFEVNAYSYVRYDVDSTDDGYIVRANHSLSQDTTGINQMDPTSVPRYLIASAFLEETILTNGSITKEDLFELSRCLVNVAGEDLRDIAPFDENVYSPVDFRYYVPCYYSTSAMIIQGVLPTEQPSLTVAWIMLGPQYTSVIVPYLITSCRALPQKSKIGSDGHSWFCIKGQQLKNSCFINVSTLNLAKLYNVNVTGVLQKIIEIEEEILKRGDKLVDELRRGTASCFDVECYYAWVDGYVDTQYQEYNLLGTILNNIDGAEEEIAGQIIEYYDILGRRVMRVSPDAIIKRCGNIGIILN